jgi:hypothetical protein
MTFHKKYIEYVLFFNPTMEIPLAKVSPAVCRKCFVRPSHRTPRRGLIGPSSDVRRENSKPDGQGNSHDGD